MENGNVGFSASSSGSYLPRAVKGKEGKSEEVRSFRLGGLGAVSRGVGDLGCDNSRMPPASHKRNRTYQEHQRLLPDKHQHPGRGHTSQGSEYFHFQPARRTTTFTSHPPLRSPAPHTVEGQRKVRNSTSTMDYMPSPERFCTPDFVKSTFNPSPSSLYLYDQDHQDMHTPFHDTPRTLLGQVCTTQNLTKLPPGEPEFDLNPQFENSNNLEGYFSGVLATGVTAGTHTESTLGFQRDMLKQKLLTISPQDLNELKPGPTLTEVNMDPYVFEDNDSITLREGGKLLPASASMQQKITENAKKEISTQIHPDLGPKTFTPLKTVRTNQSPTAIVRMLHQSQSSPSHTSSNASLSELLTKNRTHNVAVVSPIPTTSTINTIKTEPTETDSTTPTDNNPCLHKILTSPSRQTISHVRSPTTPPSSLHSGRPFVPAVGQSRRPTLGEQGKSGSVEEKWKEIEKFIHDPGSDQPRSSTATMDRKRKRRDSAESVLSDDESVKSQRIESITDDDSDSDDDSDVSDTPFEESLTELAKKSKQYFWQYNIQAKGPKGTRLRLTINDSDPHHPSNFEDPVFDPSNTSLVGIRHAGKARKGDGNEITPNPKKLYMIGQKLCKLNREINNVQLASNLPASDRSKSRKEKNKLSSRACRLKKKAQHEANKIKLFGLNCEQGELLEVVRLIWPSLRERAKQQIKENIPFSSSTLAVQIDSIIKKNCKTKTAGNTADYVNQVIAKVEEGDPAGGLPIKLKVK